MKAVTFKAATRRAATIKAMTFLGALMLASGAGAQITHNNDTGGIIPWSCENEAWAPQIAAAACAQWNKYSRITSVHRQYGDFIAYRCLWSPKVDRFAYPAVATRAYCPAGQEGADHSWPFSLPWPLPWR
jgi:hypothetical protein